MNLLRFSCCLLCALVLLSVPFSASAVTVNDEVYNIEDDTSPPLLLMGITPEDMSDGKIKLGFAPFISFRTSDGKTSYFNGTRMWEVYDNVNPITVGGNQFVDLSGYWHDDSILEHGMFLEIISTDNNTILYDKNSVMDFSATNLLNAVAVYDISGNLVTRSNWYHSSINKVLVTYYDRIGNSKTVEVTDWNSTQSSDTVNISFSSSVPFDAYEVTIFFYTDPMYEGMEQYFGDEDYVIRSSWGFRQSMFALTSSGADNSGFFASIMEWLRNIRDGIVNVKDSVANLGSGITNVFNAIKNLPSQIWTFISDGLKNLFIPSEEDMVSIKDDWDVLLSDRFGAVYEAGTLVVDWANNFSEQSAKDSISMPSVTVDLAGTPFTFGGYEVELVPDRFDFLVDILRGVLDICCTLLFVNAMKKRYDNVVGGGGA